VNSAWPVHNHFMLVLYILAGAALYAASVRILNRRAFTQARELLRKNP
jgi:hypothetical protein